MQLRAKYDWLRIGGGAALIWTALALFAYHVIEPQLLVVLCVIGTLLIYSIGIWKRG